MTRALHESGSDREPNCALLVFAKSPHAGRVKTRMEPRLGRQGALKLHQALLADAVERLSRLSQKADPLLYLADPDPGSCYAVPMRPQVGDDLGDRLRHAFAVCLDKGYDRIVVIGIDSPMMPDDRIREAFDALEEIPVIIGPCSDGGYYLLGISSDLKGLVAPRRPFLDTLFLDLPFGGSDILRKTLHRIRAAGVRHRLLPELLDLDRPEDLDRIEGELPRHTAAFLQTVLP